MGWFNFLKKKEVHVTKIKLKFKVEVNSINAPLVKRLNPTARLSAGQVAEITYEVKALHPSHYTDNAIPVAMLFNKHRVDKGELEVVRD